MSFDPSVRPFTMKLKREIWSLVILIEVDETYTMVWLSRSPKVKVKVTRPLKLRKWRFSNSISSAISQAILNLIVAYESMGQYLNLVRAGFSIFAFVSRDFKVGKKCENDDFHAKMTIFKIYLLLHFSSNLEFDCGIWIYGTISKFWSGGFSIFAFVFVSRDFKVCKNCPTFRRLYILYWAW